MPDNSGRFTTGEIRQMMKENSPMLAALTEEERNTFLENERQRDLFSPSGVKNLYAGICAFAVEEYKSAHKMRLFSDLTLDKNRTEKEIESFFGSRFFLNVTKLRSKSNAIQKIEETMINDRKRKLRRTMV